MTYTIHQGDNRDILKTLPDNSVDSIVTDPPYGIDFLGKAWDVNTGELETYQECLRVLKPGGHILAFSAARTYHHLAITLERAGFEIRDQIMWIYSSGFPKSQDVGRSIQRSLGVKETKSIQNTTLRSKQKLLDHNGITENIYANGTEQVIVTDPKAKQWEGWGTALKPAHEPICLARKPLKQSIARNVQEWGVGALNIDATRVGDPITYTNQSAFSNNIALANNGEIKHAGANMSEEITVSGRFPSNVLGEIAEPYQKYFYCPKVSRRERHIGFDLSVIPTDPGGMLNNSTGGLYNADAKPKAPPPITGKIKGCYDENGNRLAVTLNNANGGADGKGNNHPTVKPVELMKYLIRLITPQGGTVLDPYNGSGTTGMAAVELGHTYIGCELDPNYIEISHKRITAWNKKSNEFDQLFT